MPNFEFNVRGPLQFKNVDEPIMCYFLINNTHKDDYYPINVPEEMSYDFIPTKGAGTPPQTPYMYPGQIPSIQSPSKRPSVFPFTPELQVTDSTPLHTPTHTPQTSPPSIRESHIKSGHMSCPFSGDMKTKLDQQTRKISTESIGTGSLTQSESDYSSISNEGEGPSLSSGIGSMELNPPIVIMENNAESSSSPILLNSVEPIRNNTCVLYPALIEETIEKSKSDSQLLKHNQSPETTNGTSSRNRNRSPSCDRSDRSFSVTSEDSLDDDSSTPTSPSHSSVRYVRPRTSSLRDRMSVFESIPKNRRTGLSTTSYLNCSPLGSFDEAGDQL